LACVPLPEPGGPMKTISIYALLAAMELWPVVS